MPAPLREVRSRTAPTIATDALGQAAEMAALLRNAGMRATFARLECLKVLHRAEGHRMSVEEVFRALAAEQLDISVPSIYRVLLELERHGLLVREWQRGGKVIYWLRSASPRSTRFQVLCRVCSSSFEAEEGALGKALRRLGDGQGFRFLPQPITIHVTCVDCAGVA